MRSPRTSVVVALTALALAGCNAIAGIHSGTLATDDASVQASQDASLDSTADQVAPQDAAADIRSGSDVDDAPTGETGAVVDASDAGPSCASACDGGCEGDIHNCAACGNDCALLPNIGAGGLACTGGRCVYACTSGYADCADAGQGCTTELSQTANCGACGAGCSGATPVCSASGSGFACNSGCSGTTPNLCGASCTNTQTDPANCDTCGNACTTAVANAQPTCSGGACGYACAPTYTPCGSGCWNTQTDPNHCGASCGACTPPTGGTVSCNGSCVQACNVAGDQVCSNVCVNESTDDANCGGCGAACPSGKTCSSGHCVCAAGTSLCGATCSNLQSDPANCGTCAHSCLGGLCSAGVCQRWIVATPPTTSTPSGIASDGTNLVWTDPGLKEVLQIPVAGGATTVLGTQASFSGLMGVGMGGGKVAWTLSTSAVSQMWTGVESQASSGAPVWNYDDTSNTATYSPLFDSSGTHTFFTWLQNINGNITADVYSVTLATQAVATVASGVYAYGLQMATDGTYLFFTQESGDGTTGTVTRYTIASGAVATISDPFGDFNVACDGVNAYYYNGGIQRVSKSTFSGPQPVVASLGTGQGEGFAAIATDGTYVYALYQPSPGTPTLGYVPVGGGAMTQLSPVSTLPTGFPALAAVGGAIYWIDAGNNTIYGRRFP